MDIIPRKEAKIKGFSKYFTGKSYKCGHICERYVNNGGCVDCQKERYLKFRKDNKEKITEYQKEYYKINKETITKQQKDYRFKYRVDNKEKISEYQAGYRINNKEKIIEYEKVWRKNNSEKRAVIEAKRRATKLQATPAWYESEKELIETIYKCSQNSSEFIGVLHHVDHIVPLEHPLVCGLHCIDNLQVITATENQSKSNKFEVK